jgi:hypothetical protein
MRFRYRQRAFCRVRRTRVSKPGSPFQRWWPAVVAGAAVAVAMDAPFVCKRTFTYGSLGCGTEYPANDVAGLQKASRKRGGASRNRGGWDALLHDHVS